MNWVLFVKGGMRAVDRCSPDAAAAAASSWRPSVKGRAQHHDAATPQSLCMLTIGLTLSSYLKKKASGIYSENTCNSAILFIWLRHCIVCELLL